MELMRSNATLKAALAQQSTSCAFSPVYSQQALCHTGKQCIHPPPHNNATNCISSLFTSTTMANKLSEDVTKCHDRVSDGGFCPQKTHKHLHQRTPPQPEPAVGSARYARLVGRGRSRISLAADLCVPRDKPRGGASSVVRKYGPSLARPARGGQGGEPRRCHSIVEVKPTPASSCWAAKLGLYLRTTELAAKKILRPNQ